MDKGWMDYGWMEGLMDNKWIDDMWMEIFIHLFKLKKCRGYRKIEYQVQRVPI